MSSNAGAFDRWIRRPLVEMNTELEELYFARIDRSNVIGVGRQEYRGANAGDFSGMRRVGRTTPTLPACARRSADGTSRKE